MFREYVKMFDIEIYTLYNQEDIKQYNNEIKSSFGLVLDSCYDISILNFDLVGSLKIKDCNLKNLDKNFYMNLADKGIIVNFEISKEYYNNNDFYMKSRFKDVIYGYEYLALDTHVYLKKYDESNITKLDHYYLSTTGSKDLLDEIELEDNNRLSNLHYNLLSLEKREEKNKKVKI